MPPLPVVTDKEILLPTWQEYHEDVDSEPSVIDVPDFFYQNLACTGTECVFQNGIEHKIVFDSDTTDDVVDARGCQPRFAPLFVSS